MALLEAAMSDAGGLGFHRVELTKADGRRLWLYGRLPIGNLAAPVPMGAPGEHIVPNPQLRWHPLRGEWVVYAVHRQERTFLPPAGYDPLGPMVDPVYPTELPEGNYDVAVFENRFPSLHPQAHDAPSSIVETRPALGRCEVIVYTQRGSGSLGELPLWHVELVIRVWADRTREIMRTGGAAYVMPFENRGVEVGVTLLHPHGQLYAYPFVPPIPAREELLESAQPGMLGKHLAAEIQEGRRIVQLEPQAVAFLPAFARYAYEIWVAPTQPVSLLPELSDRQIGDLARCLKVALLKLDALWGKAMPYVLVVHQAPVDGPHPHSHLHIEIYPALRMRDRLKYLAGSELGAGVFTADTLPEEKARELRAIAVDID